MPPEQALPSRGFVFPLEFPPVTQVPSHAARITPAVAVPDGVIERVELGEVEMPDNGRFIHGHKPGGWLVGMGCTGSMAGCKGIAAAEAWRLADSRWLQLSFLAVPWSTAAAGWLAGAHRLS